ncbi:MAG: ATP-binding cassette domain-containing protein [Halobacteriaceae archaeon]
MAVADSTFAVHAGEVFGLVGPNGAGKTTTLKVLAGLVAPTAGTVRVAGADPDTAAARSALGWLPEESPLYEEMTARGYLRFFADLYDVPRETADERIARTLDRLDLAERSRALGDCSKGMRRKVAIARSLVNDPDLVVYDEPASGLDPVTTREVIEFTRELAAAGTTVVFSAHNLHHVESVCDRVAIMRGGELVTRGTLPEIRAAHGGTEYVVYTTVPVADAEALAAAAERGERPPGHGGAATATRAPDEATHRVVVSSMDAVDARREEAADRGGRVVDIRTREPSLEDIFLAVVDADER